MQTNYVCGSRLDSFSAVTNSVMKNAEITYKLKDGFRQHSHLRNPFNQFNLRLT